MKSPRSILITGASSGIGAALARVYARPGVSLALTGRNAERLLANADACRRAGAAVTESQIDVTDSSAMAQWQKQIDRRTPVDLIIANAGITGGAGRHGPVEPVDGVRRVFATNLDGVVNTIYPLLEAMRARGCGQLALMSSLAGFRGLPYSPAYSASKAAIRAYGEALRAQLASEGIRVNVICPGFVDTPLDNSLESPKPFRLSADKAARTICRGLARNRPRIAFPLPLYVGTRLLTMLPGSLADRFLTKLTVTVPRAE